MPHSSSRLRVLHVIGTLAPRYGGPSAAVTGLCRELVRRGLHTAIYATNIDGSGQLSVPLGKPLWRDGIEHRFFPVQWPCAYACSLPLARALKEAIPCYDVLHIHSLYLFHSAVAAHYARHFGVPYLLRPHGTLDPVVFNKNRWLKAPYEWLVEWRNLENAAAIHFTSEDEHEQALRLGLRIRGEVVPLGVELPDFANVPAAGLLQSLFPETVGKTLILFLGRITYKKGFDLLVPSFATLSRERPSLHLLIAGPDSEGYGVLVRKWLREAGIENRTTFTGLLEGELKSAAFVDSKLFVLPSYGENFGLAVVEALAHGVPVVMSNRINIWREVVQAGAGIVVNCNIQELTQAMRMILDDAALAAKLREAGPALAARNFSWQNAGGKMIAVYERILRTSTASVDSNHPFPGGA